MDDRGISPVIATIILVAVTVTAAGIVAIYVAGLSIPAGTAVLSADVDGAVFDTNPHAVDNYVNGNVRIDIKIMSDDVDDVLDPRQPLSITISGQGRTWPSFTATLKGDETEYGDVIKEPDTGYNEEGNLVDNSDIYWRLEVPTTSGGEVDEGMAIHIYLRAHIVDHGYTAWDERTTINLDVVAVRDALTLTGFDGAYLFGIADDSAA